RNLAVFEQRGDDRMSARKLFQFRGIRGVTGLDFSGFWQGQLLKENALELRIGIHIELLTRELLNGTLEGCHFLSEVGIQFLQIVAVDENAVMLHARQHLDQRELKGG